MNKQTIPQYKLKEIFSYNPFTGMLTNKVDRKRAKKGEQAGAIVTDGYRQITIYNSNYQYHHVVWAMFYGKWPEHQLDHIDHDRTNNKIDNLRPVTNQENRMNLSKRADNTSGHTGIYNFYGNKFIVRITSMGKTSNLGSYTDINEAITVRDKAYKDMGFHANHGK